jgi:hypothetical protein
MIVNRSSRILFKMDSRVHARFIALIGDLIFFSSIYE